MELLEKGGWVLAAIFGLSLLTWLLIVHKWLWLRWETKGGYRWVEGAISDLRQGNAKHAQAACRAHPGPASSMMLAVLEAFEAGRSFSPKDRKEVVARETRRLRRYLNVVAAAGAVLPLLGLLGTVFGMAKTFAALTAHASSEVSTLMAGGVSEALITTQGGLVTALPIVLLHGVLSFRVRRNVDEAALAMKRLESVAAGGKRMFESVQRQENGSESAVAVDIAPLIDMVFILLIFFLVTTTFVRETGITVNKPEAIETEALRPESLRISIAASGALYMGGRQVDLAACREAVRRYVAQERDGAVIIIPDADVRAQRLVTVMDAAKQGGAKEIAVATRRQEGP